MPKLFNKKFGFIPNEAIYIGRGSKWGNPFSHLPNSSAKFITDTREESVNAYKYYVLIDNPELFYNAKKELREQDLVCYCTPMLCHGDFLLEIANSDFDINYYKKILFNESS